MNRLAWLTDIHLNFLHDSWVEHFCRSVTDLFPDAVLIGGDISDTSEVKGHLEIMEKCLKCPVHFVLGNHDFYGGSIEDVRSVGLTVLSGHTHSRGKLEIAPNILVKTGEAKYKRPQVQELIIVE